MLRRAIAVLLILLLSGTGVPAQTSVQDIREPGNDSAGFVVRINVNLVQVDAVVTDAKGRPVTDLRAEDFEVLQDGVPQKITNFSFITAGAPPVAQPVVNSRDGRPLVPPPPVRLKPEQVHRTIALVVDDLGLSTTGVAYVRAALKKFVDHDMQPGDLVAIVRTGAGIGALQQFTTDKRLLYASIERVKFNFMGRAGSFTPINPAPAFEVGATLTLPAMGPGELSQRSGSDNNSTPSNPDRDASVAAIVSEPEDACSLATGSTVGSLAAVRYVVQGLRDLPGRKALLLFSESMQMFEAPGVIPTRPFQSGPRSGGFEPSNSWTCDYTRVKESLRKLTDAAERAAVVIYSVDPRGVDPLMFDVADNPLKNAHTMAAAGGAALPSQLGNRRDTRRRSQEGLQYLAEETGGTFVYHNDIVGAIREAVDDSGSYYLIAYHPPASTFDEKNSRWKFHNVKVEVKRPGLKVRSRTGFFGFPGRERDDIPLSREQQFSRVLVSPFTANDIRLRMTTLFSFWEKSILTTLLYVDGKDLSFTTETDGTHKAVLDAVAITFDENGLAVDDTQHTYTIRATDKGHAQALENGVILTLQHRVQRPGPYQMRVAVRDTTSQKMGSASQFVEVPDLTRHRLALSGILVRREDPAADSKEMGPGANQAAAPDPKGNEAIRIFQPGEKITWAFQILNARKGSDQQPNVMVETRLFRAGNEVYHSELLPVRWPNDTAVDRLAASGQLQLGPKFAPGDYALQVVVIDNLAKKKYAMASQWIDFEVESP